jgi:hypothetical protein
MSTTLFYRKQIKIIEKEVDDSDIAVQDFSVIVRNLPVDSTGTLCNSIISRRDQDVLRA